MQVRSFKEEQRAWKDFQKLKKACLKHVTLCITHEDLYVLMYTVLFLYFWAQSSMSCNNVELRHIMWILYWWHRFPFSSRQWALGLGLGGMSVQKKKGKKKEKKKHNSHQSHQNAEWFPAKLIPLYPTLDNNVGCCLLEQYYSINIWFAVQLEWLHI